MQTFWRGVLVIIAATLIATVLSYWFFELMGMSW